MKKRSKFALFVKIFLWIFALLAAFGLATGVFAYIFIDKQLPTIEEIRNRSVAQSTKIFDRTGKVLLYETGQTQKRTILAQNEIPQCLKDATISIEDERFYQEPAFDWRAIVRAVVMNLFKRSYVQGASTITQQLAKNAFLSPEKTITRKIKELALAIKLDRSYTKDEILALYLNEIPYGATLYGAEAASQGFFGKSARDLSVSECAALAALPKAPSYYSPWGKHVDELLKRQKVVLKKMLDLGKIDENTYKDALEKKPVFLPQSQNIKAGHFVMMVQEEMLSKYDENTFYNGGLRITTTLDADLQAAAEKAVAEGAKRNEELYKGKNAALVAEDPKTGQILALVGSRDYFDKDNQGNFNVATQGLRQPGSSLKPFVYLTAFQKGYSPDTILFDVPTEFSTDSACPLIPDFKNDDSRCFHPQNYDETYRGPISMRLALAQSLNVPAVKTLYLAGMKDTVKNAQSLGLATLNDPDTYGLSLVLGGGAVHLIDLVSAYSTLAADGAHKTQAIILDVKDAKGETLESWKEESEDVINAEYVRQINDVLSDLDARSGLFAGSLSLTTFPGYSIALKTGTSNDYRDAWVSGYTPSIVASVWAGNNNNAPMQKKGGSILAAVPIWNAFMKEALKKFPAESFPKSTLSAPLKPALSGQYIINNQIHDTLFYVSKNDPTGNPPSDPGSDPQFIKWEAAVQKWVQENNPSLSSASSLGLSATTAKPSTPVADFRIVEERPLSGDYISGSFPLVATIVAPTNIRYVKISMNSLPLGQFPVGDRTYKIQTTIFPGDLLPQNSLKIEAVLEDGKTTEESMILYKQPE